MTVCLAAIVRNERLTIKRCLNSVAPLIDSYVILDTGSTDETKKLAAKALKGIEGEILDHEWDGFGPSLNAALAAARDKSDWILRLDADMTIEAHPGFLAWLATDPDPETDAWNVLVEDHGMNYRLPLLVRGGLDWEYQGATHEWLDAQGRKTRSLLGLTVTHQGDGANREGKLERDLELLAAGVDADDPRSVFYTAEALRFLGRTDDAIRMYDRRAGLNGFVEEKWYSSYQSAKLRGDVDALIGSWQQRPHRHEPLQAAADIVTGWENHDRLFLSPPGRAF